MTQGRAQALITLTGEHGFAQWSASGAILQGWALAEHGQGRAGIVQMHAGLAAYRATGAEVFRPYGLALLAEIYGKEGQIAEGLNMLTEALAAVRNIGGYFYEAELYRLQGELLWQQVVPDEQQVESCFCQALDVARRQEAKSLELRAATSLARLWHRQGKQEQARQLLGDIYGWFTEGFNTHDLRAAQALLEELR
jgi:predicted ATPase